MSYIRDMALNVKSAHKELLLLNSDEKNKLLESISQSIEKNRQKIIMANKIDVNAAKASNMSDVMLDRLTITDDSINNIISGISNVISLDDPIGEILSENKLHNKILLKKKRVPLGVIGIIYESRPNVTVDSTILCIKTSNSVILKGGKEALNTNLSFVKFIKEGIANYGINTNIIDIVSDTSRDTTTQMMKLNNIIDVLIPRGSKNLINAVIENSTIPVIETGTGNCHIFIDNSADLDMAINILINAKTSRPSVCNSCESLLIHKNISKDYLPIIKDHLFKHNVKILGCNQTVQLLGPDVSLASDDDFKKEFLDNIISIKIVDDVYSAVTHINSYSSSHSESIITNNNKNADYFTKMVDSAVVYVNASTRFTDGNEFGFGAEIGISTQKLHARGPMGLSELTSYKYLAYGNGQIR